MRWLSRLARLICPSCGTAQRYWPAVLTMRKWSRVAPWREVNCPNCGAACRVAGTVNAQNMMRLGVGLSAALLFVLFGFAGLALAIPFAAVVPYRILGMELADDS